MMNKQPCINCGKELDMAMSILHSKKPKPGDITICLTCGHIMAFGEQLKFRNLTNEEMLTIAGNKTLLAIQKARATLKNLGKD
jgi:hypothetical protein